MVAILMQNLLIQLRKSDAPLRIISTLQNKLGLSAKLVPNGEHVTVLMSNTLPFIPLRFQDPHKIGRGQQQPDRSFKQCKKPEMPGWDIISVADR